MTKSSKDITNNQMLQAIFSRFNETDQKIVNLYQKLSKRIDDLDVKFTKRWNATEESLLKSQDKLEKRVNKLEVNVI